MKLSFLSNRAVAHAFEAIVVATATASALMVACGGSTAGNGPTANASDAGPLGDGGPVSGLSYDGFTKLQPADACGKPLALLAGIHPAHASASIQSRHVTVDDTFRENAKDGGGATDATGCREGVVTDTLVEAYGDACAQATDKPTCKHLVDCVTPPGSQWLSYVCSGPCSQTNEGTFYLEINGDALTFPTDLKAMLGSIDTPAEAVLIANMLGYQTPTGCAEPLPVAYRAVGGAYELLVVKRQDCGGGGVTQYRIRVNGDGTLEILETKEVTPPSNAQCAAGRRPEGFVLAEPGGAARSVVAYLTELAALEGASIAEFARLRDELRAHGAPRDLVRGAEAARRDEILHARLTQRLVRAFGGRPSRVRVEPRAQRTLEELAIHNAVEGCVRESFGALSATWQARHATHPDIARAFARIAEDETRHAAFSWELAAWLETRLDARAAARVANARAHALDELASAQAVAPEARVAALAGVPTVAIAQHLLAQMGDLFGFERAA